MPPALQITESNPRPHGAQARDLLSPWGALSKLPRHAPMQAPAVPQQKPDRLDAPQLPPISPISCPTYFLTRELAHFPTVSRNQHLTSAWQPRAVCLAMVQVSEDRQSPPAFQRPRRGRQPGRCTPLLLHLSNLLPAAAVALIPLVPIFTETFTL